MKYNNYNIQKGCGESLGTKMMHINKLRMRREQ